MKTASVQMQAILGPGGSDQLYVAHCYKFELRDGTVLRYTTWDKDLTVGGNTYLTGSPFVTSSKLKQTLGPSVDTVTLSIAANLTDLIEGIPVLQAISGGLFSGAIVTWYKAVMVIPGDTTPGTVTWFVGRIADVPKVGRVSADLTLSALTVLMQNKIPNRLLQASCPATLFDSLCTLSRAAFKVTSTAQVGSTANKIATTLVQPDGYFTLGSITFTSGVNAGVTRPVRVYSSGDIFLAVRFNNNPSAGDAFDIYPGCDKKQTTCDTKFGNLINFPGTPFVPVPETAI